MQNVVIVSAMRSAICKTKSGQLAHTRPDDLIATVIKESLARAPQLDWHEIDDVLVGCSVPEGEQGLNIAHLASVLAGIPSAVPAAVINRYDASSFATVAIAANAIKTGDANIVLAGGVESLTRVPEAGFNPSPPPVVLRSHPEALTPPGVAAESIADKFNISREAQDEYALLSHNKALKAWNTGQFSSEVVPVRTVNAKGEQTVVVRDDIPAEITLKELQSYSPYFIQGGSVTQGNIAPPADGATILVLMAEEKAVSLGIPPLARIKASATIGCQAEMSGYGAVLAAQKVLKKTGLTINDMDLIELCEKYASTSLAVQSELGILEDERVNPNGGSIALGYPTGAVGGRLIATMANQFYKTKGKYALMTMGVRGGQGCAMILEGVQ